jgi:hypothetical protein
VLFKQATRALGLTLGRVESCKRERRSGTTYNHHVLYGHRQVGGKLLSSPLVRGIYLLTSEIVCLRFEHPFDYSVVDGDTKERAEDLREEHIPGWDVHIVSNLHVLEL